MRRGLRTCPRPSSGIGRFDQLEVGSGLGNLHDSHRCHRTPFEGVHAWALRWPSEISLHAGLRLLHVSLTPPRLLAATFAPFSDRQAPGHAQIRVLEDGPGGVDRGAEDEGPEDRDEYWTAVQAIPVQR